MKTLYQKASHLRAHTWKDIGGFGGLLLDAAFFVFLLVMSAIVLVVGAILIAFDYLFRPVLTLMSLSRRSKKSTLDEAILLDNGTLGVRPPASPEKEKPVVKKEITLP
jgi:hypothetical protein